MIVVTTDAGCDCDLHRVFAGVFGNVLSLVFVLSSQSYWLHLLCVFYVQSLHCVVHVWHALCHALYHAL